MSMAFENVDYTSLDIPAAPFSDPARIPDFPKNKVPRHIGVIMDGNGRWAKQRGMVRTNGHQAAEPVVFDTIAGAIEAGVRYLSLYTFSTENWKRSPQEVRFLMGFSREIIHRRVEQMDEWGVRVRWSGRRPKLWKSVIDELEAAEERTKNNKVIDVVFCINYGGRAEIADACAAIAREVRDGKISGDRVTEKMIADHLYNPDIPDCDLVIRTSGEQRTSNFLPWEAAYAELDFVPELFPDCGRDAPYDVVHVQQEVAVRADAAFTGEIVGGLFVHAAWPRPIGHDQVMMSPAKPVLDCWGCEIVLVRPPLTG